MTFMTTGFINKSCDWIIMVMGRGDGWTSAERALAEELSKISMIAKELQKRFRKKEMERAKNVGIASDISTTNLNTNNDTTVGSDDPTSGVGQGMPS